MFLQSGWTALHTAASTNSVDVVNALLMEDATLIKQTSKVIKFGVLLTVIGYIVACGIF